ncbi:ABC transporter permease [Faecalicatena contorta]|uniref:ABC transporter permease n=1 Tax=Faecalicatena fissicatena TaxID=290055 RepID=A0ABS2E7N4_9FIRM|nr:MULTISPECIES: ABC-2 transporter permease [Clostridia]MBM6684444.1 ABC transporter permease [Faecalicatena contorta]MBM6709243.1 ABC transporter permease [Faecalicatena contorta]MBM6737613.1 ABC transporter permease [Faecalicatena fissicatena]
MRAIYKRELDSYFHSMIGYVFIAFFLAFTGVYFMAYNLNYGYPIFSYVLSSLVFILLIAIPVLTMKSFSEDRKSRTDQLLLTAPVSLGQIVMGKYLAMVTVYLIPNLVFCLYPLVIKLQGNAYLLTDYCGILVFFLMGCVYISIGMFLSSLTESQIIAAISSFGVLLILYLWDGILGFLPSSALLNLVILLVLLTLVSVLVWHITGNPVMAGILEVVFLAAGIIVYAVNSSVYESLLSDVLGRLDLTAPLTDVVSSSLLDTGSIILYLSVIGLFIFLTMQSIQKRRWS